MVRTQSYVWNYTPPSVLLKRSESGKDVCFAWAEGGWRCFTFSAGLATLGLVRRREGLQRVSQA